MSLLNTARFLATHPLTRQRKAQAFVNALKWQIGIRLVPGDVLVEWVGGARFITGRGDAGITGNIYAGLHDLADMAFVLHSTTKADLFVDVGANVGAYTLLACAAKGARGFCFEPVPSTYARLTRNLVINDLTTRVVAMNLGISDSEGELRFTSDNNCGNHVVGENERSVGAIKIAVKPLDSLLPGESPSLMKIDVEGFESKVLAGANATLSKRSLSAIIIEVNGPNSSEQSSLLTTMRNHNFSIYNYDPFSRRLSPKENPNVPGNTLFVRDANTVQQKLSSAPPILVGSVKI
jgi:FkbM family methyltransferase